MLLRHRRYLGEIESEKHKSSDFFIFFLALHVHCAMLCVRGSACTFQVVPRESVAPRHSETYSKNTSSYLRAAFCRIERFSTHPVHYTLNTTIFQPPCSFCQTWSRGGGHIVLRTHIFRPITVMYIVESNSRDTTISAF